MKIFKNTKMNKFFYLHKLFYISATFKQNADILNFFENSGYLLNFEQVFQLYKTLEPRNFFTQDRLQVFKSHSGHLRECFEVAENCFWLWRSWSNANSKNLENAAKTTYATFVLAFSLNFSFTNTLKEEKFTPNSSFERWKTSEVRCKTLK